MGKISEAKKIVIENYFKIECDVNTSIKEAYTKGFERGLKKYPVPTWISCDEQLPELEKDMLVTDGETMQICSLFDSSDLDDGSYQWEDDYGYWGPFDMWTHWMPLPDLPKGEKR